MHLHLLGAGVYRLALARSSKRLCSVRRISHELAKTPNYRKLAWPVPMAFDWQSLAD